ncbi:MAG: hypothetical protein QNJ44_00560 [Rhodobacter sp.]|nr:hypothetical protein [Rhodobacter sp.]
MDGSFALAVDPPGLCLPAAGFVQGGRVAARRIATGSKLLRIADGRNGEDHTGIDGKEFPVQEAVGDAAGDHDLEEVSQQSALAAPAVTVLGNASMIRHRTGQIEPAGQVQMELVAVPSFRPFDVFVRLDPGACMDEI